MKKILVSCMMAFISMAALAQGGGKYSEKVVFLNDDVIFRQIDEHTWEGNGHLMANETVYIVEGNDKAVLIDAGTNIPGLRKIAEGITSKPLTLIVTHVHPDHTGAAINDFPYLYMNAADMVGVPEFMPEYKGEKRFLKDGQVIDLGGRQLEVVFTPGHTPGSTTFVDKENGYGFSGDSFGSGNLLVFTTLRTEVGTCNLMSAYMGKYGINKLFPGHYYGVNAETKKRVEDIGTLCSGVLTGKRKGEKADKPTLDLDLVVTDFGANVRFNNNAIK